MAFGDGSVGAMPRSDDQASRRLSLMGQASAVYRLYLGNA